MVFTVYMVVWLGETVGFPAVGAKVGSEGIDSQI
jgi:hypothetical protein